MTNRERQKRYYRWLLEATRQGVLNNEKIDLRVIKRRYWFVAVTTPDGALAYFTLDEFYAMLDIGIAYAQAIKEQRLKKEIEGGNNLNITIKLNNNEKVSRNKRSPR